MSIVSGTVGSILGSGDSKKKISMTRELHSNELKLCLDGGLAFFDEGKLPGKFDPETFLTKIGSFIDGGSGVVIGYFNDNVIRGAIGGIKYADIYTNDLVATEMWWFVLPQYRGGTAAMRLIRAFQTWAKASGCKRCSMVHLAGLQPERLKHVYESLGYSLTETCYSLTLDS